MTVLDKTALLNAIVSRHKEQDGGRAMFVRRDGKTGRWYEITDDRAKEKIGHCLREAAAAAISPADEGGTMSEQERCEEQRRFVEKHSDMLKSQRSIFLALLASSNLK